MVPEMTTLAWVVVVLIAVGGCGVTNEQTADNNNPGAGGDGATDSGAEQNSGGGASGVQVSDCCAADGSPAATEAKPPEDVRHESYPEVDAGCSCSKEGENVYRTSLACFCQQGGCQDYSPDLARGLCGLPGTIGSANTHVRMSSSAACPVIVLELIAIDAPTTTWVFDANTSKVLEVSLGSSDRALRAICQNLGSMAYGSIVAGVGYDLPACGALETQDLCAKKDASSSGDGQ
jgi:hypothetical protein